MIFLEKVTCHRKRAFLPIRYVFIKFFNFKIDIHDEGILSVVASPPFLAKKSSVLQELVIFTTCIGSEKVRKVRVIIFVSD